MVPPIIYGFDRKARQKTRRAARQTLSKMHDRWIVTFCYQITVVLQDGPSPLQTGEVCVSYTQDKTEEVLRPAQILQRHATVCGPERFLRGDVQKI